MASVIGKGGLAGYRGDMHAQEPQTALASVVWRRFLLSAWPWRSAGYLLSTSLVILTGLPALLLFTPWIAAAGQVRAGDASPVRTVFLVLAGAILLAGAGPLVAAPVAVVERWRLRLVDVRPLAGDGGNARSGRGAWRWLRSRYTEPAAWRELGYTIVVVTVVPVAYAAVAAVPVLAGILIASPLLAAGGHGPVSLGVGQVTSAGPAVPYALAGLVLLPVIPFLLAVLAGAHGALARALAAGDAGERLRAELTDVRRSRARLADAFEAERRRIERDLHDGAQQRLVSLTMQLGLARLDLPPGSPAAAAVADAHQQAKQLMAELRELIQGIHPRVLADRGLPAALEELADRCPVPVTVHTAVSGRLPSQVETTAYFAVAEALTNIAKHSAAGQASVTARHQDSTLTIDISDDGHGGADPGRGTGLTGLADRVAVINGKVSLSSPPGGPTLLRMELPCPSNR
jgi:signal transduction histidine kinase